MKRLLIALALVLSAGTASAEPVRVLLAIGARRGLAEEAKLRHSLTDARRMRDVLVTLGRVRPENAILLEDPRAAAVRQALELATERARGYSRGDVVFLLYFSGHGDQRRLHLDGEVVGLDELASRMEAVPAALRIAVLDACRTTRPKGVSAERAFGVRVGAAAPAAGTAWIHAAAEGEAAQESDALGGAIFTHYFVSGLRGAADRDGDRRVTLAEAYGYAFNATLHRSALSAGVLQHPAASLQLREHAPIVLTETTPRSAVLRLPREADTQYLVYAVGARAVVAEAWSNALRVAEIALPPGHFFVHRRTIGRSSVADVTLSRAEQRQLGNNDFKTVADEAVLAKGGDLVLRPHALSATYGVRAGTLFGPGHGGRAAYAHRFGDFVLGLGLELGRGFGREDGPNNVEFEWYGGEARVERNVDIARVQARFGVRATALHGRQTVVRSDAERFDAPGLSVKRGYDGWLGGGGVVARVVVPFGYGFAEMGGTVDLLGTRRGEELEAAYAAGFEAGAGVTF